MAQLTFAIRVLQKCSILIAIKQTIHISFVYIVFANGERFIELYVMKSFSNNHKKAVNF